MKKILIAFLFILTAIPAAFSAPMEIGEHSPSVIPMECSDNGCIVSDPQYQTNQYKSIKGTIYYSPRSPVRNFDKPVMVEYRSDDGVHSARFTANPHFGFVIPIKAPGTITFTIRDPNSKYTIDPATYKTDDFPPEGRSIVVKEKTAQPAPAAEQPATPATSTTSTRASVTRATTQQTKQSDNASAVTKVTGKVVDFNDQEPLIAAGVCVKGTTTCTVTNDSGEFSLIVEQGKYTNPRIEISYPAYVSKDFALASDLGTISLSGEQLKETIIQGNKCDTNDTLQGLNATSAKLMETDELVSPDSKAKKSICIPTNCKKGFLLEHANSVNAKCVTCDGKIPFAKTYKTENNQCIVDKCENDFVKVGNECLVDCDKYKKQLNATAVARKSVQPTKPESDYSKYCYATQCDETKSFAEGTGENKSCKSNVGTSCIGPMKEVEPNALTAKFDGNGLCVLDTCDSAYNAVKTTLSKKCDSVVPGLRCSGECELRVGAECEFDGENAKSSKGTLDKNGVCKPDCYDNFVAKLNSTKDKYECVIKTDRDGTECTKNELKSMNIAHATAGTVKEWDRATGAVTSCTITECDDGWLPNAAGDGCDEICTAEITQKLKNDGAFDVRVSDDGKTCVAKSCKCEYTLTDDGKCVPWAESGHTECGKKPEGATGGTPHCDGGKEVCYITTCDEPKYTLEGTAGTANAKCVSNVGKDCNDVVALPENATAGKQREIDGQMKCVATACKTGYDLRPDGSACVPKMVLSKEEYQDQIAELSANAAAMHEKENSWENRLIGAAGIGLTGVGGMMVGSALSEQTADANAEATMRQYLETFRCDYGDGKLIHGGEVNVELPGGNDMIELYTEYATRAADLKARKEALGMRPGIESEIVIDKAETGLYEYSPDGITGGTYASIARALMDPEGEDAAMWAAQKAATDAKLKAGAIVAGVGSVGSLAANIAVNHNNPNKVREILNTYAPLRKPFKDMEHKVNDVATQEPTKCSTIAGTTGIGNVPNCQCIDPDARYFHDKGCITCPMNQVYNAEKKCVCPTDKPVLKDDGSCEPKAPDCLLTGLKKDNACECITNARSENNRCVCATGYHESEDSSVKECLKDKEPVPVTNIPTTPTSSILDTGNEIAKISFGTDGLFESSRSELKPTSATKIRSELQNIQTIAQQNNIDLKTATDYCLVVVGKTDRVPFRKGVNSNNQILSEQRARAVAVELQSVFNSDNIRTYGIADNDCHKDKFQRDAQDCRRVDVLFLGGSCADNLSGISNDTAWIKTLAPYAVNALISELSKK